MIYSDLFECFSQTHVGAACWVTFRLTGETALFSSDLNAALKLLRAADSPEQTG